MLALWFTVLGAADGVLVELHTSPVLHTINQLLGHLDAFYLTKLRAYGGSHRLLHRIGLARGNSP